MVEYKHKELTSEIINAAHTVHNELGYGFLEKIYHKSLFIELRKRGYRVEIEQPVEVRYDGQVVGEFLADLLVENKVIVEVKAVDKYTNVFEAQLLKGHRTRSRPDYQFWPIRSSQAYGFVTVS